MPSASTVAGRIGWGLAVLMGVSLCLFQSCGDQWKSSVETFTFDDHSDRRLRFTETRGVECVTLEYQNMNPGRHQFEWRESGKDCAWMRVADSDRWMAGGQAEPVGGKSGWIFFGIVPAAAAEVEITLADGAHHTFTTRKMGNGTNRIYVDHVPGLDDRAKVVSLRLLDAQGGELHVY